MGRNPYFGNSNKPPSLKLAEQEADIRWDIYNQKLASLEQQLQDLVKHHYLWDSHDIP